MTKTEGNQTPDQSTKSELRSSAATIAEALIEFVELNPIDLTTPRHEPVATRRGSVEVGAPQPADASRAEVASRPSPEARDATTAAPEPPRDGPSSSEPQPPDGVPQLAMEF